MPVMAMLKSVNQSVALQYMPLGKDECCLRYVCSIVIVLLRIQSFCNNYVIPHDFEPLTVS